MKTIVARHIMSKDVAVRPGTKAKDALFMILTSQNDGVPIVDAQMNLHGIVTEFDLLGHIREGRDLGEIDIEKVLITDVKTAGPDTTSDELIEIMLEAGFSILPILKDGKYLGVISRRSILETYLDPLFFRAYDDDEL